MTGADSALTLTTRVHTTIGFGDLGSMSYVYRADGTDELLALSVSDCQALAQSTLLSAIQESAMKLLIVDRRGQVGPDAAERERIVQSLVLFFSGTKLIDDCRIYFPQDRWGCDGLSFFILRTVGCVLRHARWMLRPVRL